MAQLPNQKRILKEDLREAPSWIDKLLYPLNSFMESVYFALNRNLNFQENIASQIYEIEFTTASDYPIPGGDPMTTRGDLIYRDPTNATTRLGRGTAGQVLTSDGTDISWQPSAAGFSDPMTTRGDLIYRNPSNATTRLGRGTSDTVLKSDGTDISYGKITNANVDNAAAIAFSKMADLTTNRVLVSDGSGDVSASSVTNTTLGYLDATSSIQTQINGKQDTLVSGTNIKTINSNSLLGSGDISISASVAWGGITGTLSDQTDVSTAINAKLTNPMTTNGDLITTAAATPSRIAVGTNGQVLTVVSGAPAWAAAPGGTQIIANGNTGDVTANASDTYLTGSALAIGGQIKAGTVLKWTLMMTKTAAGIATPNIYVRFGTAGTTADTARLTFTGTVQTAATDTGMITITATVSVVGASGVVRGGFHQTHTNTTTGLMNVARPRVLTATSGTFDNTSGSLIAGISVQPGTAGVWTFQVVEGQAYNLA